MLFAKKILLLLVLLMSSAFAYQLAIGVTVSQGTRAPGSNVTLIRGGVELYNANADSSGFAVFNVSAGEYFVLLNRNSYPPSVSLINVAHDTNITLSMNSQFSYATVFGQVTGPQNFENSAVIVSSNGQRVTRATPDNDGNFIVSYLPDGNYQFLFSAPGFNNETTSVSLAAGDATQVDSSLQAIAVQQNATMQQSLSAPSQVNQYSLIEVDLIGAANPAGQSISAQTPSGATTLTTDSQGGASINAAQGGTYVFSYGGLSATTDVISAQPAVQPVQNTTAPAQQPQQSPPQPQQPLSGPETFGVAFLVAGIVVLVIVAIALYLFLRKQASRKNNQEPEHHGAQELQEQEAPRHGEKPKHVPEHKHEPEHKHKGHHHAKE